MQAPARLRSKWICRRLHTPQSSCLDNSAPVQDCSAVRHRKDWGYGQSGARWRSGDTVRLSQTHHVSGASAPERGSTGCLRYLDGPPQANSLLDSLSRAGIAPNAVRLDTVHRWSRWSRADQVLQRRPDSAPQRSPRGHTGGGLLHLAPHQLSAAARDPYNRRRQETLYATGAPASTIRAEQRLLANHISPRPRPWRHDRIHLRSLPWSSQPYSLWALGCSHTNSDRWGDTNHLVQSSPASLRQEPHEPPAPRSRSRSSIRDLVKIP